jgi:adenylylsulfate kinase
MVGQGDFVEVYCDAPIEVCETRDVKGLYKKARAGEIAEFTGISSPYQKPEVPEMVLNTGTDSLDRCVQEVMGNIAKLGVFTSTHLNQDLQLKKQHEGNKTQP